MDNYDHGPEEWDEFQLWLKRQHEKGCTLFGLGVDDIGFVSYEASNITNRDRVAMELLRRYHAVEILKDPDDDPRCFVFLQEVCGSTDLHEQLAWARQFFLPITV